MKHRYLILSLLICTALGLRAQIVTSEPTPLLQSSKNVVIYYHADQGNKGLINQPASDPIYAHTGVITSNSTGDGDWKHAPGWGDNAAKYKLEYVSPNLWKLDIGSIDTYYNLQPGEEVRKLAFVFRNGAKTKEGKTQNGGDIFLTVYQEGLHISLSSDQTGSVLNGPATIHLTASTTAAADISLSVNGTEFASAKNATTLSKGYEVKDYGTYTFTARASANGEVAEASETFSYLAASTRKDYPGGVPQMGPVVNADGSVTFCLAAPQKNSCVIVGSWDDYAILSDNTMYYQDYQGYRYFWTTVKGLDASNRYLYYFLVDGTYRVGDPYARLVLDAQYDKYIPADVFPDMPKYPSDKVDNVPLAVWQADINDYDWQTTDFTAPDQDNLIVYELLIRDFTGTEGSALGNGTVRGALAKLPYLKALGVNAIELLPINEFNGNASWGYNPNFYFAPDKAYGTPDDYKLFIDSCHELGMAVILDIVFNQTDWLHPWYQLYEPGQNPFYNADAPHAYSVLNDWNQGNPLVQEQFKDVLRYWLSEYRVDGFRFDLVKGLGDNSSYANAGDAATNAYNASRVARMKELHAAMKEVNPLAYCINENLAGEKEENEMAADGEINWANINGQSGQYAMGYQSNSALSRFYAPYDKRTWGSTVSYMESHDEQRLAYLQSTNGATGIKGNIPNSMKRLGCVAAQMILAPGSHMLWQFQELGNDQNTKTSSGNDTGNKKVLWSYLNNEYRRGLYDNYRELIGLRLANPELFSREAAFTSSLGDNDWAAGRTIVNSTADKEIITVINPNVNPRDAITVKVAFSQSNYKVVSKSYLTEPTFDVAAGTVTVPANSYVVLASAGITGIEEVLADGEMPQDGEMPEGANVTYEGAEQIYTLSGHRVTAPLSDLPAALYIIRTSAGPRKLLLP